MNEDVKRKLLDALRSGEYEQGTGVLEENDKFCCLGVLCDIARREGIVSRQIRTTRGMWDEEGVLYDEEEVLYDGERYELPAAVMAWAGLDDSVVTLPNPMDAVVQRYLDAHVRKDAAAASLVNLNDNGASFEEIAQVIEEQL